MIMGTAINYPKIKLVNQWLAQNLPKLPQLVDLSITASSIHISSGLLPGFQFSTAFPSRVSYTADYSLGSTLLHQHYLYALRYSCSDVKAWLTLLSSKQHLAFIQTE